MKKIIFLYISLFSCTYCYTQRILKDNISIFYKNDRHNLNISQKNKVNDFITHYKDAKINKIVIVSSADYKGNNLYNDFKPNKEISFLNSTKLLGDNPYLIEQQLKDGKVSFGK